MEMINKSGQVTIFVIIGLVIVFAAAIAVLIYESPFSGPGTDENPKDFIRTCIEQDVEDILSTISLQGGYVNTADAVGFIDYDKEKVSYLCHTPDNDELCITQEPLLKKHTEDAIKNYISPKLEECFADLENEYKKYSYEAGPTNFEVVLNPGRIDFEIEKDITIIKKETTGDYNSFGFFVKHPMWDFVVLSQNIILEEGTCNCGNEHCGADLILLSKANRDYEFDKFTTGNNENVYTFQELNSENKFMFAVRNCVRLP